jgi:hypothetical protein
MTPMTTRTIMQRTSELIALLALVAVLAGFYKDTAMGVFVAAAGGIGLAVAPRMPAPMRVGMVITSMVALGFAVVIIIQSIL